MRIQSAAGTALCRTGTIAASLAIMSTPVAAAHGSTSCPSNSAFGPLFQLLHSLTELAFIAGVALATFGFAFAGISYIIPGEEWNRRGKQAAKNVLIGTIIMLSSNMVVSFLVRELGGVTC